MSCTFGTFMFDSGEEFPPLTFWNFRYFVGVRLDLPTSSCIVCVEGVIVVIDDYFSIG